MDGVQLPQGYSHFEEAVYFLPLSSQIFLVLILSTSEGWKAESSLEPPSSFEHGTPGLGIQRLNHYFNIALLTLHYINVLLFDVGLYDFVSFSVAPFNVHYLMLHFFMCLCLMLH